MDRMALLVEFAGQPGMAAAMLAKAVDDHHGGPVVYLRQPALLVKAQAVAASESLVMVLHGGEFYPKRRVGYKPR